ncbi:WecB/TagA/CpsF family glycosyltransferase [Erythrobacter sp. SG61-1L]|uniref:WecB/TagA/CpsF family glycosyltransferase n=1 Tax=Erythrobacter sp. SG61-1L TaxID=1603897 RepID=UPI0006C93697|nr:WecB/TagA/CpsF family glycosyltransferase [Erythrobacter sp. SG61-1L]
MNPFAISRAHRIDPLFGLPLVNGSRAAMAAEIAACAQIGANCVINFVNAHCVNTLRSDRSYSAALEASDLLLPDGSGMRIAAKMAGVPMGENLNGTDLFPEICAQLARTGDTIFLLGGLPGVARDAADAMCRRFPGLRFAGTMDGYFTPQEEDAVIARINASGARILMVGFGVPLQEKWIERNRSRLTVPVLMGVGGLFDYYSGRIARAPAPIRAIGCEWAWRLAMEPRRLANRYLLGNAAFLAHAALNAARQRGFNEVASLAAKRALDLAVTAIAMIVLAPIFLATALAIKLDDGGPVFFRQVRIGKGGRNFSMLKFRSMRVDAEARRAALLAQSERDTTCFKMKHDPRITRIGRFLRRFSLDELPQLINVLTGEMSLVGPRPALPSEVETYGAAAWPRLRGKPGITCIWQVSGRADIAFARQVAMDRAYFARRTLATDIALLARTVPAVVSGRGAY